MTSLESTVREEIRRRGRVTFAEFMSWALYHPRGGYYTSGPGRAGRAGDFVTNVQVPLYAELLAEQFVEMWDALGSERFTLVELGAGDGVLAERILRELERRDRHRRIAFHLVEAGSPAREAARRRLSRYPGVSVHAGLEDLEHTAGVEGCVYSNEFFDALPVHRVQGGPRGLQELFVEERDGRLRESPRDLSMPELGDTLRDDGVALAEGQQGEISRDMPEIVSALGRLLSRGFVLTVDYGGPAQDLYGETRPRGTLRCFEKQRLGDDPFANIGGRDITAHVDFTRLARLGEREGLWPLVYANQGAYLVAAGENVLRRAVEEGPEGSRRAREVQQLVHPSAFGGAFRILIQGRNVGDIRLAAEKASRLQRLGLGREVGADRLTGG